MKKIDSLLLVCSAGISQQLVSLGILPVACNCYESVAGIWEFAGEYIGQHPVIPAWTMEELNILIGGNFPQYIVIVEKKGLGIVRYPKPDLPSDKYWSPTANMMKYILHLPTKRVETLNGAEAYGKMLCELLLAKEVLAFDCNERLRAFTTKDMFNPMTEQLEKERKY